MRDVSLLGRWVEYSPKAIALKDLDRSRSFCYKELDERSRYLAGLLNAEYGISRGDRVALLSPNEPEVFFLFFALQALGAILVPLNWRLSTRELQTLVSDCSPKLFIFHSELKSSADVIVGPSFRECLGAQSVVDRAMTDSLERQAVAGFSPALEDPCLILYTSGTTGTPKGAMLSNRMLLWNSMSTAIRLQISTQDKTLIFHPLFHTSGWNVLSIPFLYNGACVNLLRKFDAERVLDACVSEELTILFGVPTMMGMMAHAPSFGERHFPSLRYAIVGGEPMPIPLIEAWAEKSVPVRQGFGLTEFGPNCFSLPEEDAIRKRGSIGFANPFVDVRIVGDDGTEVPCGEVGELLLRGPAMMSGYWGNPGATATTMGDGWLRTGDLVRRDEEGYFYVAGRKKDMFISGAENVYPAEVEQFLAAHPGVREVAVVGVADEKWGEVGKAFVVPKAASGLDEAEIRRYCDGNLAKYKIPKYFSFIAELPKSDSGKVLKRALH